MRHRGFTKILGMILASLALAGCSDETASRFTSTSGTISGASSSPASPSPSSDADEVDKATAAERSKSPSSDAEEVTKATAAQKSKSPTTGRKIIYNTRLDLVTEDLNQFEIRLIDLIALNQAYIADSDRTGSMGSTRHGTWKVRVPVDLYDPFVKGSLALGELVSQKANSQDVSEEYFDLDARQTAKKVEEARLLKHLTDSTGKLDEILAVERELSRVRSEIERMQGRLRALANLISLATVTITASEIKDYVPPEAPTLGTRLGRTFANSLEALRQLGEAALIAFVAIVPWIPLIAIGLGIVVWISRRGVISIPRTAVAGPFLPPKDRG